MALKSPVTPRRVYFKSNICVLCGYAFVQREVTASGETIEKKFFNKKLKLTRDRVVLIQKVLEEFSPEDETDNGVCKNCFRGVEKLIKMDEEMKNLQQQISEARRVVRHKYQLATPSPSKTKIEKRLLKSPQASEQSKKLQRTFPVAVNLVQTVTVPTFDELLGIKAPHQPTQVGQSESGAAYSDIRKEKATKRALQFTAEEPHGPSIRKEKEKIFEGEVKVRTVVLKCSYLKVLIFKVALMSHVQDVFTTRLLNTLNVLNFLFKNSKCIKVHYLW